MFEHLKSKIEDFTSISANPPETLRLLNETYPGIPASYLAFLEEIGHGDINGAAFYEGRIDSAFVYPTLQATLAGIKLFSDDYQGYCYGFDTQNQYRVVEVEPGGNFRVLDESFLEFIEGYVPFPADS